MQRTPASQGTLVFYEHCLTWKEGKYHWITVMLDTGHPGNTSEHNRNTPGCIFPCFLPENPSQICFMHLYTPHDIIATKTMPPSGRAYPQVYCVQIWSKSDWQFPRYSHFCIIPLSLIFSIWPLSAPDHPAPETWPQNWHQHHNNRSPSLPRPLQMLLPVHWQLGQPQSACLSMTGTPKMHTTPSPYFAIPWRTGSSSTTYHQAARTTSGMFLQP